MVFVLLSENPSLLNTAEGRASLSALTPQQVDRAFELFDEYRNQVKIFLSGRSDCPQLLLSRDVSMCPASHSRIYEVVRKGGPLRICWECGHVVSTGGWGIIRGLKEKSPHTFELAQLYMAWTALPENNARMAQFIAYGPINTASLPYLSRPEYNSVRNDLPSSLSNLSYAIFTDEVHAAQHKDTWLERWIALLGTAR